MTSAEKLKELGNSAFKSKDFDKAIWFYSEGLEVDPKHAILYSNRSAAFIEKHRYEEALQDSVKAISLNSLYLKAYHRKATCLLELGRPLDSLEVIKAAQDLHPGCKDFDELKIKALKDTQIDSVLPANHIERAKFNKLANWLREGGAIFPKLQMRFYSEDFRGVHSLRFIQKDECLLFVPKSHIISLEMAKASPIGQKIKEAGLDLISPKHCFLATFLLQESRKNDSFWRPFLEILPQKFRNFPIFFSEEEKSWLEGSPFLDQIREKIEDIQTDYESLCGAVPEFSEFLIEDFSKTRMAVSSRIFGIKMNGVKTDVFVPLADMLNHKRPRQTTWTYDQEREGFIIEALEDIQRGQEVLDSYGQKCNSRFLLNYGFINRNNDANEYPFKVALSEEDEHFNMKKSLLGASFQTFRLQAQASGSVFYEFLAVLRLAELDEIEQIPKLLRESQDDKGAFQATRIGPVSVSNETKAIKKFQLLAAEGLSRYPTALEEDLEVLKRDLSENERNCTLMRLGEKTILQFFLDFTGFVLSVIDLNLNELKEIRMKGSEFDDYIFTTLLGLKRE